MPNSTGYHPVSNNLIDSPILQPSQNGVPPVTLDYQRYCRSIQIGESPTRLIRILCDGVLALSRELSISNPIYSVDQQIEIVKLWIRTDIQQGNQFSYILPIERIEELITQASEYLQSLHYN